jgi:hypothetical protein
MKVDYAINISGYDLDLFGFAHQRLLKISELMNSLHLLRTSILFCPRESVGMPLHASKAIWQLHWQEPCGRHEKCLLHPVTTHPVVALQLQIDPAKTAYFHLWELDTFWQSREY